MIHLEVALALTNITFTLSGDCSFYELAAPSTKPSKGLDMAMWSNTKPGQMWRFRGRCSVPCTGTYRPETLRIRVVLDKASTNFSVSKDTNPLQQNPEFNQLRERMFIPLAAHVNFVFMVKKVRNLKLWRDVYYVPALIDRGHTVFGLSVCLSAKDFYIGHNF